MAELHVIGDTGDVEVWLDTEIEEGDGIVIGVGATRIQALDSARAELQARLVEVDALIREEDLALRLGGTGA